MLLKKKSTFIQRDLCHFFWTKKRVVGRCKPGAFTLIELLVVIVIIGILATISVAQFNEYQERARRALLAAQITQEKKIYLAECVSQAKDICPVTFVVRQKNGTLYTASALACEQVCADNDERMATVEESLWFAKNKANQCNYMWHYVDNTASSVFFGYPMYINRTTTGCGPINTGNVSRFVVSSIADTAIEHVGEIYPSFEYLIRDINDTPSNADCACISYPDF